MGGRVERRVSSMTKENGPGCAKDKIKAKFSLIPPLSPHDVLRTLLHLVSPSPLFPFRPSTPSPLLQILSYSASPSPKMYCEIYITSRFPIPPSFLPPFRPSTPSPLPPFLPSPFPLPPLPLLPPLPPLFSLPPFDFRFLPSSGSRRAFLERRSAALSRARRF